MTVKKDKNNWLVDLYPNGRNGKRVRKRFNSKIEAVRFEKFVLSKSSGGKEWNPSKADTRKLLDLIEIWYEVKGIHLKDGEKRKRRLIDFAKSLGNPVAKGLKPKAFITYVAVRKAAGIADKTLNNILGYINAVFHHLEDIEEIDYSNPLSKVSAIKIDERELSWLTSEQIEHLLTTIQGFSKNPHVLLLTKICLATGARWGEAEGLEPRHVRNGKVTFINTKSGKSRSVPISDKLLDELNTHLETWGEFTGSLSAFRRALKKTCIELPKGQAAHVLRHSFASHFIMNGGNILTLQKIMGHASITMTMRYAHLAPDHLLEAVKKNPLSSYKER